MKRLIPFTLLAGLLASASLLNAQEAAASPEARMRESLRATTLQLRSAQNDLSAAVAARDALTTEKTAVETELANLKKQLVADRLDNDKVVAAFKTSVSTQATELAATTDELTKTRASLAKVVDYARKLETERNALTSRVAILETQAADYHDRNIALYKISTEILDRYAKFALGEAILAREPFIGITRVKIENLVQDYSDRLMSQRLNGSTAPAAETPPTP